MEETYIINFRINEILLNSVFTSILLKSDLFMFFVGRNLCSDVNRLVLR